jgi:hypothetical protein
MNLMQRLVFDEFDAILIFPRFAGQAARTRPDLMIHLGDYLYRESPCQPGDNRCTGTPWGDNWATWNADFFEPAAPLLHHTVWLMARGNHDECGRAGNGFTRSHPAYPGLENNRPCVGRHCFAPLRISIAQIKVRNRKQDPI